MSQDFTENKRYLKDFATASGCLLLLSVVCTVAYIAGQKDIRKEAIALGHAAETEKGFQWQSLRYLNLVKGE